MRVSSFHLNIEAIVVLLIGLISLLSISGNKEAQGKRGKDGEIDGQWSRQNTHINWLSVPWSDMGMVYGVATNYNTNTKNHWLQIAEEV